MLLPGLLGPGGLQLLEVPQLGVELVHPSGLGLVGHVVLLEQLAGGLARPQPLDDLEAAVVPPLGHPVDVLLEAVHVGVLGRVRPGLLHGGSDLLHVLLQLVDHILIKRSNTIEFLDF